MRSLLEVAVLAAVVALAWEKSISQRVGEAIPALQPALAARSATRAPALRAQPAAATASESGAWMWDPNRRSVLDRPAYDPKERHAWTVDNYGRRYWVDAQGARHYEP